MNNRIHTLKESPCFQCNQQNKCMERIRKNPKLMEICDNVIGNKNFDYHKCGIWIAINVNEKMRGESNKQGC